MPKYTPSPIQLQLPFDEVQPGYCKCGCGQKTRLAHQSITKYGWIKGEPIPFVHGHNQRRPFLDRFWKNVNKQAPGGCWLWTGGKMSGGYGMTSIGMERWLTHRLSYTLHFGPIQDDMFICHKCDVRLCVNPDHLFVGTPADNIHDMMEKGRENRTVFSRGEDVSSSIVTAAQVIEIRQLCAAGVPRKETAKKFGIARSTVTAIFTRQNWKHIE